MTDRLQLRAGDRVRCENWDEATVVAAGGDGLVLVRRDPLGTLSIEAVSDLALVGLTTPSSAGAVWAAAEPLVNLWTRHLPDSAKIARRELLRRLGVELDESAAFHDALVGDSLDGMDADIAEAARLAADRLDALDDRHRWLSAISDLRRLAQAAEAEHEVRHREAVAALARSDQRSAEVEHRARMKFEHDARCLQVGRSILGETG